MNSEIKAFWENIGEVSSATVGNKKCNRTDWFVLKKNGDHLHFAAEYKSGDQQESYYFYKGILYLEDVMIKMVRLKIFL